MTNPITKTCCACKEEKPLDDFKRHSQAKDGKQPRCAACQVVQRKARYDKDPEKYKAKSSAWRLANQDIAKERDRAKYWADPEKAKAANKRYREKNSIEYLAQKKRKRDSTLESSRERERLWRASNPESIAKRKREYRDTNPNIRLGERANYHRRRSQTVGGPSGLEIRAKMDYHGNLCWMCGGAGSSIDHVKPLAVGGAHMLSNLRPACNPCNSRKRDRWYGISRIDELKAWVLLRLTA